MTNNHITKLFCDKEKKGAFTLAEVLITIAIIGITAALTIPIIITRIQDAEYSTKAKKMFSVLQQAYELSLMDTSLSGYGAYTCTVAPNNKKWEGLVSKMRAIKTCNGNTFGNCWVDGGVPGITGGDCYFFNQDVQNDNSAFVAPDGTTVMLYGNNSTSWSCDLILVDLNGFRKGPNQFNTDIISWNLQDKTIEIPTGGCGGGMSGRKYITN